MLVLILGPMKSGKSAELIARTEPYKIGGKKVVYLKPKMDVRNDGIESRLGAKVEAVEIDKEAWFKDYPKADVYAIDEAHMFEVSLADYVKRWLKDGAEVIISTLDTTYDGTVFPVINLIYGLKPDEIVLKKAVCEVCKELPASAKYTQILNHENQPLVSNLPENLAEDGRFKYEARCFKCFVSDVWN